MRLLAILCALTLSSAARAQGAPGPDEGGPPRMQRMRERFEKKVRMMRLLEVSEALDLSDTEALRFDQVMRKYDAQKKPFVQQIGEGVRVLRRASQGDATVFAEVDRTIARLLDARGKIQSLDRQMYDELAKGLSPQRRAKLALVLARLPGDLRDLARQAKRGFQHWRQRGQNGPNGPNAPMPPEPGPMPNEGE